MLEEAESFRGQTSTGLQVKGGIVYKRLDENHKDDF